eukprot:324052_1
MESLKQFDLIVFIICTMQLFSIQSRILPVDCSLTTVTELPENTNLNASIGNGYIGYKVGGDTIYISGIYNGVDAYSPIVNSTTVSKRARIPSTSSIILQITSSNSIFMKKYNLDFNDATYYIEYLSIDNTSIYNITQYIYAHRVYDNLLINEIHINNTNNPFDLEISLINYSGSKSESFNFTYLNDTQCTLDSTEINSHYISCQIGYTYMCEGNASCPLIGVGIIYFDTNKIKQIKVNSGEYRILYYPSIFLTSLESSNIINDMKLLFTQLYSNRSAWMSQHVNAWNNIWLNGRIDIFDVDTNYSDLCINIYSSLYYIYSNSNLNNWTYGYSCGGIATNGHNGGIFWDQETWQYPILLFLNNNFAYNAILYRYNRITAAHLNAIYTGYGDKKALRFPWVSSYTGLETTPPPWIMGKNEIHINADIGLAVIQYFWMNFNITYLKNIAFSILKGITQFIINRSYLNNKTQKYEWHNVCCPDEYASNVNNSIYTNYGFKKIVAYTIYAANILNYTYPNIWNNVVNNIYIPFDNKNEYHPEYDGYILGTPIKQADVALLNYPWHFNYTAYGNNNVFCNDLSYYLNVTAVDLYGMDMTWNIYTIQWLKSKCKKYTYVKTSFINSYINNLHHPFYIWSENKNDGGSQDWNTGAAGFIQQFIFGFAGMRLNDSFLFINKLSYLPFFNKMSIIGVDYQYNSLDFTFNNVTKNISVTVTSRKTNKHQLSLIYSNETEIVLNINKTIIVQSNLQPIRISVLNGN